MKTLSLQNDLLELLGTSTCTTRPTFSEMPVLIYGAGQMGAESSKYLRASGVQVTAFLDKNPAMVGRYIDDLPVLHPDQITSAQRQHALFAIGVVKCSYNSIVQFLQSMGCQHICYVGHLVDSVYSGASIANVWYFENMSAQERETLVRTFETLHDDASRAALLQLLSWIKLGVERDDLPPISAPDDKYFIPELTSKLTRQEVFVDCGAFQGSTICRIEQRTDGHYEAIHAFEPEPANYQLLLQARDANPHRDRIFTYPFGLGSEDGDRNFTVGLGLTSRYSDTDPGLPIPMRRLDSVLHEITPTVLKVYGLGIGWEVLEGSRATLRKCRPMIAINIHHSRADVTGVPQFLMRHLPRYRLLLRLHGYCGTEAVMYAIPEER
ncbi:MAG: FkbM family methyltransferase [Pirellulaceae bacterium]